MRTLTEWRAWWRLQGRSMTTQSEYQRYLVRLAERVPLEEATLADVLEFVADGATPAIRRQRSVLLPGLLPVGAQPFLDGANWAYAAGIIAVLAGATLVFFMFPKKHDEEALLASYHDADTTSAPAAT